jgi:hypothetical protein
MNAIEYLPSVPHTVYGLGRQHRHPQIIRRSVERVNVQVMQLRLITCIVIIPIQYPHPQVI